MKKIKEGKGITLIALIITIVVLLILAGVAIGTLQESNIIGRAKEAAGSFNQAKDNEVSTLVKAEETMEDIIAKLNKEPSQSGIKVYFREGMGFYILTPENEMKFFRNGSPVEEDAIYVTEGKGNWTIQHEGFSNEEINNLKYLYNDDVKTIFAVTSDRNLLVLPADINSDSKTVKFSNSSDTAVRHNEEYVSQYYNEEQNVEYWYGKWDRFTRGNVTRSAGERLYKIDYNNNTITWYGKNNSADNSWTKQLDSFTIENKGTNSRDINVTLDGKPLTINVNAVKFDYLFYSGYYITCYFQDDKMYVDIDSEIVDGKELTSGYHSHTRIKYINTSLLPQ